jgi:hypothetical protein
MTMTGAPEATVDVVFGVDDEVDEAGWLAARNVDSGGCADGTGCEVDDVGRAGPEECVVEPLEGAGVSGVAATGCGD